MNTNNFYEEKKRLLKESGDKKRCEQAFLLAQMLCRERNVFLTNAQQLSLLSHISAMVQRSLTGEKLIPFDRAIFSGISNDSLYIAKKIKDLVMGLEEEEIYLLSIHFEAAK
ncbi:PRD domain protein (TIGR03582 family) [Virgibacillus halotolerans]|uniref:PRD domain-containing protein n=1 Tax=Virgibacillus halotolerans TaxID=1071053 RepID=UPI0019609A64|nr:PRD domain-containing protein [Virgibacillus halotolerans]MBM7599021.1 PRD domain protein (TIGR03582 family) [Virgibacillus halotolerans]